MMPWVRRALRMTCVAGWVAVLAACATPQYIGGADTDAFERVGRFAVTAEQPYETPQAAQGGFAWRDTGRVLLVDLATPLGATLARVRVEPGRASLVPAEGDTRYAADPDALLYQVLGVAVPVRYLRYWLRGQVGPDDLTGLELDDQQRPVRFVQHGWVVGLSRYDAQGPQLLRLEHRDAGQVYKVRLVVDAAATAPATQP